jgi:hypothetical protein
MNETTPSNVITRATLLLTGALLFPLAGCGGASEPGVEPADPAAAAASASEASSRSRTLPIPGQDMPADHPPLGAGSGPLVWDVPAGWVEEAPASSMRKNQYRVSGESGDAECVVYYFGPGQGGDPLANAQRWAGQFSQPDGSSSLEHMQVTELTSARVPVQIVEVTGTYDGGMTMTDQPAQEKTGYMLLGGIALGSDAPWFFKLTGPEPLVRAQRDAFVEMMESIRSDG